MKGIVVPPQEEDFTADPVELFFDLAFVFAFSRLVYHVVHHPDWAGVGEFVVLLVLIWLPWSNFTWSANAVSGNDRRVRFLFLIGTAASVPMAASATAAFGDGGAAFAIPLAVIMLLGLATGLVALGPDLPAFASTVRYSIPNIIAAVLLVIGSFLERELRLTFWIISILIVVYGTIRAGSSDWLVRPGHFAERHGLIMIVALGEVIVAVALPVVNGLEDGEGVPSRTLWALICAGTFACLLWWAYFDRVNLSLEFRHESLEHGERGRFARDVYTYSHLPIIGGVILMAAALEEITLHPKDILATEFRWMLFGGMAAFFGGVAISVWRAFKVIARERIIALGVRLVLTLAAGSMDGLVFLVLVDLLLLAVIVAEHVRIEGVGSTTSDDPIDNVASA